MSNRTERITVRLTKEQKDRIKIMAIKRDMTVSELFLVSLSRYIAEEERQNEYRCSNCIYKEPGKI